MLTTMLMGNRFIVVEPLFLPNIVIRRGKARVRHIREGDQMLTVRGTGSAKPRLTLCRIKTSTFQAGNSTVRTLFTKREIPVLMYLVQTLAYRCLSRSFNRATKLSFNLVRWKSLSTKDLPLDMETVNTTEHLRGLRNLMREHKLDVYSRKHGDNRA